MYFWFLVNQPFCAKNVSDKAMHVFTHKQRRERMHMSQSTGNARVVNIAA